MQKTSSKLDPESIALARQQLASAQRILIVAHVHPDGDAIGSLLGLGLALRDAGKDIQLVSEDGIPGPHRKIPGSELVRKNFEGPIDLSIVVDCSDRDRAGNSLHEIASPDWNIDHHITNLNFAKINIVDPKAVATAEVIADLLPELGLTMTSEIASALLTGLITDTIGFQTSNMTSKALRLAADLVDMGVNLPMLYRHFLVQRSFEAVRLWGAGLSQIERDQGLVWATLTQADRQVIGYSGRDDADLIQVLFSIEDAHIAIIFVEQPNQRVKVSWRALPGYDISKVALQFGGGGHPSAAGAEVAGTLAETYAAVIPATRILLEKDGNE
jgi:bifunctional oligoribonuclease and PAP phosphatase NrnA